jgi:rSAM/selenodomain-associated transferase 1
MKKGIIIFQKNTELGKVKTRIAESLGEKKALEIYQVLVNYTHLQLQSLECEKLLYYSDYIENDFENFDQTYRAFIQTKGDLGQKMGSAFANQFKEGFSNLLIIGTDCPEISPEIIQEAFEKLENKEVVIGPATDGGYYLLGLKRFIPGLFLDIPWSSEKVLSTTQNFLEVNKISFALLPLLSDIDYQDDWEKFKDKLLKTQA